MWAYFTLKLGWLKTTAGTNMGPQNGMYLSTFGYPRATLLLSDRHELI